LEILKGLVRSLAAIIILTSFMEMMLPDDKMKHYTRLVLGLFVIITILSPVQKILSDPSGISFEEWAVPAAGKETQNILENAKEFSAQSQVLAEREYAARLEQQINALVRLAPEIESAEVSVSLMPDSRFSMGAIKEVLVKGKVRNQFSTAAPGRQKEDEGAADVEIGKEAGNSMTEEYPEEFLTQVERRIESVVGDFYGLNTDQVVVLLKD